jgi:5'-3' exonuclease
VRIAAENSRVLPPGSTCLIDLTGFLHRLAYMPGPHGIDPIKVTSKKTGEPTWGLVGTFNQLNTLARLCPGRIIAFSDSSKDGFRLELLPTYKRKSGNPYIRHQLDRLSNCLPHLGIQVFGAREEFPGMEAEDLIAKAVMDEREPVVVVSYDKDLLQLVGPRASHYNPQKKQLVEATSIDEALKTQFMPTKANLTGPDLAVFLAVTGDETDGVKPIGGIGRATLGWYYEKLPEGLSNPEKIEALAAIDREIKFVNSKPVTANWGQALINLQATDLQTERQRSIPLGDISNPTPHKEAFRAVLEELTMGSFLKNYDAWFAPFARLNQPAMEIS